jgi:ethanolamine ammonia-lyase small subunit
MELQARAHQGDDLPSLAALARSKTPARIFVGRAGPTYRTETSLALRADHAAALDAVRAELAPECDLSADLRREFGIFEIQSRARTRQEYLRRPDLGRLLDESAVQRLIAEVPAAADLQVVIGDGLSAAAVGAQVPDLLPRLKDAARARGWQFGRPFCVRNCRVGILNAIGDCLKPSVVVLLIGERPGLATAESLSAYMAYEPRGGHTDADRNLISNIHARGVSLDAAAARIVDLAQQMRAAGMSGVAIKERPAVGR